jgi:hypothetical protein
MKIANLVLIAALAGCATPPEIIQGPNGNQATLLTCTKIQDCYIAAREECKGNYTIINQSGSGAVNHINTGYIQYYTVDEHKLLIECK